MKAFYAVNYGSEVYRDIILIPKAKGEVGEAVFNPTAEDLSRFISSRNYQNENWSSDPKPVDEALEEYGDSLEEIKEWYTEVHEPAEQRKVIVACRDDQEEELNILHNDIWQQEKQRRQG